MFRRLDANSDGAVTPQEWVDQGAPAEAFPALDSDKDGVLSLEEVTAFIAASSKPK